MNVKGRLSERVMKQPFCCLARWSAYTPAWPECKPLWHSVSRLQTAHLVLQTKAHQVRLGRTGDDRDVSGELDYSLECCAMGTSCSSTSPSSLTTPSRRHCLQCRNFIGLFTCVNRLYFCLTRHNFHFCPGRPFTRVPQILSACQTCWVTLVYTWGPHSICMCSKNTCVKKILHQVFKHLWFCLIKSL